MWLIALTVPAMAVAFLVGLMRWWVYVGASLRRLTTRLGTPLAPSELRSALADAFEDPSLDVVYRRADGWVDGDGRTLATPAPGPGRCLTEIVNGEPGRRRLDPRSRHSLRARVQRRRRLLRP